MATSNKVPLLLFYIALVLLSCLLHSSNATSSSSVEDQVQRKGSLGVRRLLLKAELAEDDDKENKPKPPTKKIKSSITNTTSPSKLLNKSPPISDQLPPPKPKQKKLNSTISSIKLSSKNSTMLLTTKSKKLSNSTSKATDPTKSSDLISSSSPNNKTTKIKNLTPPNSITAPKIKKTKDQVIDTKSKLLKKQNPKDSNPNPKQKPTGIQKSTLPSWIDQEEEDDLVSDFRDLPSKFQQTLLPDLESISQTSKAYLTKANKQMTRNFKPLVGTKYASTTANFASFAFIIIPLLLVSLLISRIKTYFSLQKLLIFINIYLAIYFSILSLSAVVTGLEPLRFFFATSQSTYVGLQILQTLCYVMYLLLLVMYLLLLAVSTKIGLGSKLLGLGQTLVGFAVGLHYYVAVIHRAVTHQPPKTNWKVHAVYATCFFVICLFATAERRKKEYLEEGGEEGKKN